MLKIIYKMFIIILGKEVGEKQYTLEEQPATSGMVGFSFLNGNKYFVNSRLFLYLKSEICLEKVYT
ncbi:hypothetical protein [Paenisporosarcina sp. TG20]|uniref:hypothetical protein n=1 Tax=Paenisporosarcina sp. TG20 TaxID=1211706 RepID=UPI0002F68333|nr:hypothetical protein [Paenisporosarcina sp. TG20]